MPGHEQAPLPTPAAADAVMQDLSRTEIPASAMPTTETAGGIAPTAANYDHLLGIGASNPGEAQPGAQREQPPLTDEQVAKMGAQRGKPVTDDERKYMDMARARGMHHDTV